MNKGGVLFKRGWFFIKERTACLERGLLLSRLLSGGGSLNKGGIPFEEGGLGGGFFKKG